MRKNCLYNELLQDSGHIPGVQAETLDEPLMKKITARGENYEKTDFKGASQSCRKISIFFSGPSARGANLAG